jgi:hypothetical protein
MTHLTYLVIFHLKMIVCQNVNLQHTYGHHLQKHPFVDDNYQTLHMIHKFIPII